MTKDMPSSGITVFIDESGDLGLINVAHSHHDRGASAFLVMSAVAVRNENLDLLRDRFESVANTLSVPSLHATELNHFKKAYWGRQFGKLPARCFSIISRKETLGSYQTEFLTDAETSKPQAEFYYNKCTSFLLEMVGKFASGRGIEPNDVDMLIEEREGHDYDRLRRFLSTVRRNPKTERARLLQAIEPSRLRSIKKCDDIRLAAADYAAHAIYSAAAPLRSNYGLPEQRYLREISHLFEKSEGSRLGTSISIPKWHADLKNGPFEFEEHTEAFFRSWALAEKRDL